MGAKKWAMGFGVLLMAGAVGLSAGCAADTEQSDQAANETEEPTAAPEDPFEANGVVWIAGDSIASPHDQPEYEEPIIGWGEFLADYMTDNATVHNEARSGRSAKSYTIETNYKTIMSKMQAGDCLLIAFGLNDEHEEYDKLYSDPEGSSDTEGSFQYYLKHDYIEPALEAGVQPVLMTPVTRNFFNKDEGHTVETQTPYVNAIYTLVEEYAQQGISIYCIDLFEITEQWYEEIGADKVQQFHGVNAEGEEDGHFNAAGAAELAKRIAENIREQNMSLSAYLK
ncbi:MAG: SGNH/GDSL hydrolase family protein [Lachnospiraceae bacterium]